MIGWYSCVYEKDIGPLSRLSSINLASEVSESSCPVYFSKNEVMLRSSDIVLCMCDAGVSAAVGVPAFVVAKVIMLLGLIRDIGTILLLFII